MSYSEDTFDSYQDVEIDLDVKRNQQYWLTLVVGKDEYGLVPAVKVCSTEYPLKENEILYFSSEIENMQLVTRYTYTNALDVTKACKGIILAVLTAILVAVPAVTDKKIRVLAGIAGFVLFPIVVGKRLEALNLVQQFYLPDS